MTQTWTSMPKALKLFLSSFFTVFLLGFQSINAVHYYYGLATITSIGIGWSSIYLYRLIPEKMSVFDFLAYSLGGILGITGSMYLHQIILFS
jgi:hypothetical protein